MKDNILAIGVSHREYFRIMLSYYPKNLSENFDIFLFVDNKKEILDDIKEIISEFDIPIFNNAKIVVNSEMISEYSEKLNLTKNGQKFAYQFGACFKLLVPIYLKEKYNKTKIFAIDDDIFILDDLSYIFENYNGWVFKKENLFVLKNSDKFKVLEEFNSIFQFDFNLEEINNLSLNSGTILYDIDDEYKSQVKRFIENTYIQNIFFNNSGFTAWTLEQRFQHFNMHYLMAKNRGVKLFVSKEVRLVDQVGKEQIGKNYLKKVVPSIIHYAIGVKKPLWLRKFIPGIKWKYNIDYKPKYELKNILYNKDWKPKRFKIVHEEKKKNFKSLF